MPYLAEVYRVLIASPSDVVRDRKAAVETIHEWNATEGDARGVSLQPFQWELSAAPEMGERPQAIVNRQIVDKCDILIGIFWTRFGTPTGIARSGTEEEVARFLASHKRVMLYFSDAPILPSDLDRCQYEMVREYKARCAGKGLFETYDDISVFKAKLRSNLSMTLDGMIKGDLKFEDRGVRNCLSMWAGKIDDVFILEQRHLRIFLKDGFTFFKNKYDSLKKRLSNARRATSILILHPDYEHMKAVADMDTEKKGRAEIQREDCLTAIRTLHKIRDELLRDKNVDIAQTVDFVGYRSIPTWNGFIGTTEAIIHLYPAKRYRGDLKTLRINAKDKDGNTAEWYQKYQEEFDEIMRITKAEYADSNLWAYIL